MVELSETDNARLAVVSAALKVVGSVGASDLEASNADQELDLAVLRHALLLTKEAEDA